MIKLIKLEWQKNRITKYLRYTVILAGVLGLFLFALAFGGIAYDPGTGILDAAPGKEVISAPVELFTSMAFLVFTSIMLASFVVTPYQNKTMNLMFSYPIKRQKILISQMLAVWIFNVLALVLTKLLLYGSIAVGAQYMTSAFSLDFAMAEVSFYVQLIMKSLVIVTMSFIALFVGMAMKSSKATVVTSFLLILLTQANVGDLTMADNAVLPAVLMGISLLFVLLSLYRVETKDLM